MSEPDINKVQNDVLDSVDNNDQQKDSNKEKQEVESTPDKQNNPEDLLKDTSAELKSAETLNNVVKDSAESAREHAYIDEELKELDTNSEVLANIPRGEIFEPDSPDFYEQEKIQLEEARKRAAARSQELPATQTERTDTELDDKQDKTATKDVVDIVQSEDTQKDLQKNSVSSISESTDPPAVEQNSKEYKPTTNNAVSEPAINNAENPTNDNAQETVTTVTEDVDKNKQVEKNRQETKNNDKVTDPGKETKTESNEKKQTPSEEDFNRYVRLRAMLERRIGYLEKRGGRDSADEKGIRGTEEEENRIKDHTGGQDWEKMYPDQVKKAEERRAERQKRAKEEQEKKQKLAEQQRTEEENAQNKPENNTDTEKREQETEKTSNQEEKERKEEGDKQDNEKISDIEKQLETVTKLFENNKEQMQKFETRMNSIEERLNKLAEKMEFMIKTPEQTENEKTPSQQQEQKPTSTESRQSIELEGLSEEAAEWKIKEAALKNKLYSANNAWVKSKNSSDYNTYLKTYNELAKHNTKAWHSDALMGEEVYKSYENLNPRPEIQPVNRSITLSGNLVYNELGPDKIKPQEVTDIAKTLQWERQKNPAVVDFQFAKGFRVNLWQMRSETRELIEKKIVELGGNNYEMIKPAQPAEADSAASVKGAETTAPNIPESYKEAYEELLRMGEDAKKTKKEVEKQRKAYDLTLDIVNKLYSSKNVNEYVLDDLEKYEMSEDEAAEFISKLKGAGFYTGQNKDTGKYYVRRRF